MLKLSSFVLAVAAVIERVLFAVSPEQAARMLCIPRGTLSRAIARGLIPVSYSFRRGRPAAFSSERRRTAAALAVLGGGRPGFVATVAVV